MTRWYLREFNSTDEMAKAAAKLFFQAAINAIAMRGRFMCAIPGGTTPRKTFSLLSSYSFGTSLDWSAVHLVPSDERAVAQTDPASNTGMIRANLLECLPVKKGGREVNFHPPLFNGSSSAGEVAENWERHLRGIFENEVNDGFPIFDFALLGMGEDGHTASLFPGDKALEERFRWCAAVTPRGDPAVARVTLTMPVLTRARSLCFIATGDEKSSLVKRIVSFGAPQLDLPASVAASSSETNWLIA